MWTNFVIVSQWLQNMSDLLTVSGKNSTDQVKILRNQRRRKKKIFSSLVKGWMHLQCQCWEILEKRVVNILSAEPSLKNKLFNVTVFCLFDNPTPFLAEWQSNLPFIQHYDMWQFTVMSCVFRNLLAQNQCGEKSGKETRNITREIGMH